ncbi:MAG TPA: trehalose-phosphatase [Candidatus Polarisedimenticolia bacterium]|nr:trehalose-phosphatase [Candidatus Polarisedimenticolia bacterium]
MTTPASRPTFLQLPPDFWERVVSADYRLLLLDYDGTLAPFRVERASAVPMPGIVELLKELSSASRCQVGILSGRPIEQLTGFLGELPVHLVGESGWETRYRESTTIHHPLPPDSEAMLREAFTAAESTGLSRYLERKRTSLVLHTRGLDASRAHALEASWRELWSTLPAARSFLSFAPVNGGQEARAAGRDKGTAVREILALCPTGTLAVHVGDDWTDEDAFRELFGSGFGVRVGSADRPSMATGRILSCEAISGFLRMWRQAIATDPPVGIRS